MGKLTSRLGVGSALILMVFILLGTSLFFALKRGIEIEQLTLAGMRIQQFHIRLDKKLAIDIGDITVTTEKKRQREMVPLSRIRTAMLYADGAGRWFESITVRRMAINDTVATFAYSGNGSGSLTVDDPAFHLDTALSLSGSRVSVDIKQFKSIDYHSQGRGRIELDIQHKQFIADLLVDVADSLPLSLHCEGDQNRLTFEGSGTQSVHTIRPVVEVFHLGPDIQPWITDYLKGSSITLESIKGTVLFKSPEKVFDTLYGKASVQDTEYSFEQKLPAIKAPSTEVVFENGILKIYPHHPTYAGVDAGKSWLDINFNPDEPVLSAYIKTQTPLGDEILALLDFYEIHLPFKQTKGLTDADLTLAINLATIDVNAHGNFRVAEGAFEYDKQTYTVTDAAISLVNDAVDITKVNIGLQDLLRMKATGTMKITSRKADFKIGVEKVDLPLEDTRLILDTAARPLLLEYRWAQEGETLTASESAWKVGTQSAKAQGFTASFKAGNFSGTLPPTQISVSPSPRFLLSGDFNLKKPEFNLIADFQSWESDGLKLDQPHFPVALVLGKTLDVSSTAESGWLINGKKVILAPFKLNYAKKNITVGQAGLRFGDILDGSLQGEFDLSTGKGSFTLDRLAIGNMNKNSFDFSGEHLRADVAKKDNAFKITIPELGLSYERNNVSGWAVHIEDLGKLYDRSAFMQKYNLNTGAIDIWGATDDPPYLFSGSITYQYDFLVKNNMPVNDYAFKGQYDGVKWAATVNDDFHLESSDRMHITSNGVGYNIAALRTYLADHPVDENEKAGRKIPDMDVQADKSSLYLNPFQNAPIDELQAHSEGGLLTGQLKFGKGKAQLEMNGTNFTLLGQEFDENFMDRILKKSKFIGGKLSFYLNGSWEKFTGVMKIDNSVLKEGAVLNNVLTFVNTVPDLVTFSLPDYNLQGLPFNQLYVGFTYNTDVIDVKTFAIESNVLDMAGTGVIHLPENTIDMNIDLVGKTKQTISKIPLLGYILVGDQKQPTITLTVSGDLDDPDISTSTYKEIVKTPFDMLLRTINLPNHLLKQMERGASGEDVAVPGTSSGNDATK
jgi:hypothetical protein